MAKYPKRYSGYYPPGITYPSSETFRGYGSDGSEATGHIIYIGNDNVERIVGLKAFIETIKINIDKDGAYTEGKDKNHKIYKPYSGHLSYNITINVPAHSVNESRNNLAKISELQRYIVPGDALDERKIKKLTGTTAELGKAFPKNSFSVFFKNLINNGIDYSGWPKISSYDDLYKWGMPCYIESLNYEPDMDAGFFRWGNFNFPRNIKLNLTLNYNPDGLKVSGDDAVIVGSAGTQIQTITSFNVNGHYGQTDSQLFPFLVSVKTSGHAELNSELATQDFTTSEMNSYKYLNATNSLYIFISMVIDGNSNEGLPGTEDYAMYSAVNSRRRYVVFKPYIESFTREVKVDTTTKDAKETDIDKSQIYTTFNGIDYKFKFNVVADNLIEAKKNCGKIQYLMRMFFKPKTGKATDNNLKDRAGYLKVYIPEMLEKAGASRTVSRNSFSSMYENAIALVPDSFNFEIDADAGFFEEGVGKLYPKIMSVEMGFSLDDKRNLNQFNALKYEDESGTERSEYTISYDKYTGNSTFKENIGDKNPLLFPMNIKYANVKKGG